MGLTRKILAILGLVLVAGCTPATTGTPALGTATGVAAVDNIILLIGDGVGTAYWSAAKFAADSLAVQQMPVLGLVDTRNASLRVTDSAAGATVYAAGVRTYNNAVGVGVRCLEMFRADSARVMQNPAACDPLVSYFDVARERGMATGLVATSTITHATPASFGAHVPHRRMEAEIAAQYVEKGFDVLLGGGRGFFDGTARNDGRNYWTEMCRNAACITTAEELARYRPDNRPLFGLFAEGQMEPAAERQPSLPEMTRVALERLSRNPRGFVVMIEGSQPDWRGHDNAPMPTVIDEMLDFDRAIGVALEFARANPRTLVVVTSDHETGGLSLVHRADTLTALYTTIGHTGEMVPLFAFGPGAERFGGIRENYEIGRLLMELVRNRR